MNEPMRKEVQDIVNTQGKVCKEKFKRQDEISSTILSEIKQLRKEIAHLREDVTRSRIQNATLTTKVAFLLIGASALVSTIVSFAFKAIG